MRSRRMIPVLAAVATAMSLVVMAGPAALAKEDVKARLTTPLPLDAPPGTAITVAWTLNSTDEQGVPRPFNAIGVFVRLSGAADGAEPTMGFATADDHSDGRYDARVTVPEGGLRGVEIGLRGTTDVIFPLENDPFALPAAAHPARANEAPSEGSSPTWLPAAGALAVVPAIGVLWLLARRARRRAEPGHLRPS